MFFIKFAIFFALTNYYTSLEIDPSLIPENCSNSAESIQHLQVFFTDGNYLGEGSFGKVYSFQDEVTKEKMAVKIINVKDEKAANEIIKEINVMKEFFGNFDLMGISSYDSCFYEKKEEIYVFYLVMEAMGENLLSLIMKPKHKYNRQLSWQIYTIFAITKALEQLHKVGYLHLDIKPQNILMKDIFTPVICDFGFSAKAEPANKEKPFGTPAYAAPEIFTNFYYYQTDVYALGVVFFQIFNPLINIYVKGKTAEIIRKFCSLSGPSIYCSYFDKIIQRMISHEYSKRPLLQEVEKLIRTVTVVLFKEIDLVAKNERDKMATVVTGFDNRYSNCNRILQTLSPYCLMKEVVNVEKDKRLPYYLDYSVFLNSKRFIFYYLDSQNQSVFDKNFKEYSKDLVNYELNRKNNLAKKTQTRLKRNNLENRVSQRVSENDIASFKTNYLVTTNILLI